jgi:hypothetical protein
VAVGTGHGLKDLSAVSLDTASGATSPQDLLREI